MDPHLGFWSAALANLGVIVLCTTTGVRRIRAGDVAGHRRRMLTGMSLIGLFLVAYIGKVVVLGREDKSAWTTLDFAVLYGHEVCVISMLIGGALALYRAARFRKGLGAGLRLPPAEQPLEGRRGHRRAGWIAVVGSVLGLATSIGVLAGMFARAAAG